MKNMRKEMEDAMRAKDELAVCILDPLPRRVLACCLETSH
jgi:hypothetical protein